MARAERDLTQLASDGAPDELVNRPRSSSPLPANLDAQPRPVTRTGVSWRDEARTLLLGRVIVAGFAAVALWAFITNRLLDYWIDGLAKQLTIYGFGLTLCVCFVFPLVTRYRLVATRASLLLLVCSAVGEAHRHWLRHDLEADSGEADVRSSGPVTTTTLVTRRFRAEIPGLSTPLRGLHLSDLHLTEALPADYYRDVQRALAARAPELLLLTGDYVSKPERLAMLKDFLVGLPRPRFGSYAVLGNHDYWSGQQHNITAMLEKAGVVVLSGRCVGVELTRGAVRVCGTDAPWGAELRADAARVAGFDAAPILALSHSPDNMDALTALGAAAVFAGHTHGGQFRLPLLGPLLMPSRHGRLFDRGSFLVEGARLFVSPGIGADQPPLRLFCPPELYEIELVPGATR